MTCHRQNKAQEYRTRAAEARRRAAAAKTATIRKTQTEDAEMFERMAEREERAIISNQRDDRFLDWEPDRLAGHYRLGAKLYRDKEG